MAARKAGGSKGAEPTPVEAITHPEKRANLPLAGAAEFVSPEVEAPRRLLYPRDPSLDPQLVWRGKDATDAADLGVDAPPIFIQEKIDPRVLIENLRRTAGPGEAEPELTLFETFDGLGELDRVDYYRHDANWSNRMVLGDSLQVMASLAERESLRGKVQMIYVDPPYGIKFGSNWQARVDRRDVRDGRVEDASREVEMIKAFRDTWELGIHSYLGYLRDRLVVARDLLTETGSVFVQIGDENVHLVRSIMDEVFGSDNFAGMFAFRTKIPLRTTLVPSIYDFVLWYARDLSRVKFRRLFRERRLGKGTQFTHIELPDGTRRRMTAAEFEDPDRVVGRVFRLSDLVSAGRTESCVFGFDFAGRTHFPSGRKSWKTNQDGMRRLVTANRIHSSGGSPSYVFYADDYPVEELDNVWSDTQGAPDRLYAVQTSTKIVDRCLLMSTDPGDLVLDPTCGSGTTAYVAEQRGRRWITVDTSRVALALARQRLMGARYPYYVLADSEAGRRKEGELASEPLAPARPSNDIRRGFVYPRVHHITLGSIAQNPDIREGMSRDEIDAAIARHADTELLVDRPYEDRGVVRVAGPFTVESLSPHRSLTTGGGEPAGPAGEERARTDPASSAAFEAMILDNLRKAGIQNGKRKERLSLDLLEAYPGICIQAVGTRTPGPGATGASGDTGDAGDSDATHDTDGSGGPGGSERAGAPARVAVALGPQYGTVGPAFIKAAAREAMAMGDVDVLCVLGFAFDPAAVDSTDGYVASDAGFDVAAERSLGRVPVLLVRMNADLLMGDDLKKTGAGNLFTVFGEPDIAISEKAGEVTVELRGVDVYDPTTGDVRSQGPDRVALWMIDTDYDGESFFVRHCYFTGGTDPYKRLKTALRADIDPEAWESLYSTVSRPFPRPEHGAVAVKVIDDYGDEVTKVFDLSAEA